MEENQGRAGALLSSFRDPGGFLFTHEGVIYRQVNISCKESYDELMASGLYDSLVANCRRSINLISYSQYFECLVGSEGYTRH